MRRRSGRAQCGGRCTDTRTAEHLLDLLLTKGFPRIWVPTAEERDLRQLLKHRDKLVRMQTSVRNQLQFLGTSQGVCRISPDQSKDRNPFQGQGKCSEARRMMSTTK